LEQRAAELVAAGQRNGQSIGRGRLARELEISEHQAGQLLERLPTNAEPVPGASLLPADTS
jgi:hypothetical protein